MSDERRDVTVSRERIEAFLRTLERLAAGDTGANLAISPMHDELDAMAHGVNVLADELRWAHAMITASERVKVEELREALAHLGRVAMLDVLTGSLAHEVNQPLTAAITNSAAALHLLSANPPELNELRHTLIDILYESKRAAEILERMRTLLKKGSARYEPVDVNSTINDILRLIQSNAISRRIALDVELATTLDLVLGDRIQIQQVVLNLLMNAFDAVQDQAVAARRVRLRTISSGPMAAIEVSDEGAGLSDDAVAALFEPFRTTKRDGLGLGLWICRGIVTAHGGTLNATRNAGAGMTFSATFPVRQVVVGVVQPAPVPSQRQEH